MAVPGNVECSLRLDVEATDDALPSSTQVHPGVAEAPAALPQLLISCRAKYGGTSLPAISTPWARPPRARRSSRVRPSAARFKMLVGGGSRVEGEGAVVSVERKVNIMIKSPTAYKAEQFISDGDRTYIAATTADHGRTTLGEFVKSPPLVLQAGLLGGALSTGWNC